MLKLKVVFGDFIRLFKFDHAERLDEALGALNDFVSANLKGKNFTLRYKDDENDFVRIDSAEDLKDALELVPDGKTLKVFVAKSEDVKEVNETNEADFKSEDGVEEKTPDSEEHETNFESDLLNDDNFRHELVALLQDIVIQVREGDNLQAAVTTALASHPSLSEISHVKKFVSFLPVLSAHPFIVPFISQLDPNTIPDMVELFFNSLKTGNDANLPPLIQLLRTQFGGMMNGNGNQPNINPQMLGQMFGGLNGGFNGNGCGSNNGFRGGYRGRGFRGFCGGRGFRHGGFPWQRHGYYGYGQNTQDDWIPKDYGLGAEMLAEDVSLCDKAPVLPNQTVIKTWRLKNTGKDWPEGTQLVYIGRRDNPLVQKNKRFNVSALKSDEKGNCSVVLDIPPQSGNHSCVWRLHTPNGHAFGPMLRARVVVLQDSNDVEEAKEQESEIEIEIEVTNDDVPQSQPDYEQELQMLSSMGFNNVELNRFLLDEHHGEVNTVLQILCEIKA